MDRTFNFGNDFTKENDLEFVPYFNYEDNSLHCFPGTLPKDILINLGQNSLPDFNYINNINEIIPENLNSDNNDEVFFFGKAKNNLLFNIDKIIPEPVLEDEINVFMKKMNMDNEMKEKYFLDSRNACDKIERIKEKILLNSNKRRKKMKKKKKTESKMKHGRKKKKINRIKVMIDILQII